MRGSLRRIFIVLFTLVFLLLSAGAFLLGTRQGTQLLLKELQLLVHGGLQIGRIEGHFFDALELDHVRIRLQDRQQTIDSLKWSWRPAALAQGLLEISSVHIRGARLNLPTSSEPETGEAETLGFSLPPLDISIGEIRIEDLQIQAESAPPHKIDRFEFSGDLLDGDLRIARLTLHTPEGSLQAGGEGGLQPPYPLQGSIDWTWALADGVSARGRLMVSGDSRLLQLKHGGEPPLSFELRATLKDLLDTPEWDLTLSWPRFLPPAQFVVGDLELGAGRLQSQGSLDGYGLTIQAGHAGGGLPPAAWDINAQGNAQGVDISRLSGRLLGGDLELDGRVDWSAGLTAKLAFRTQGLDLSGFQADLPAQMEAGGRLDVAYADGRLVLHELLLSLDGSPAQLIFSAHLQTDSAKGDGKLEWRGLQWPLESETPLVSSTEGVCTLAGTPADFSIDLAADLTPPQVGQGRWSLTGRGGKDRFTIQRLSAELLGGTLDIQGSLSHQPELSADLSLQAKGLNLSSLVPEWPSAVPMDLQGRLNLEQDRLRISSVQVQLPAAATELKFQAEGRIAADVLESRIEAELVWSGLRWPLDSEALVGSPTGRLHFEGQPTDYRIELETELDGRQVPPGSWRLSGSGNLQEMQLQALDGRVLDGSVQARGRLHWAPDIAWKLTLSGADLDPAGQVPGWPGRLDLKADTEGGIGSDGQPSARVRIERISGHLKEWPLELSARLETRKGIYFVEEFNLRSDDNRLEAQGEASASADRLDLHWDLQLPNPGRLLPGATGEAHWSGDLTGGFKAPNINTRLSAKGLGLNDLHLQHLTADLQLGLSADGPLELQLEAIDFNKGAEPLIKELKIHAQGRLDQHRLSLGMTAPQLKLDTELQGGLDLASARWAGVLNRLSADTQSAGHWQLVDPSPLLLSGEHMNLSRSCLKNIKEEGALCLAAEQRASGQSTLSARLEQVSLSLFAPMLSGRLTADLQGALGAEGKLSGLLQADLSPGKVKVLMDHRERALSHQGGRLRAEIGENGLHAQLNLRPLQQGKIEADIQMPALSALPLPQRQPISGRLLAELPDLGLIQAFVPQLSNTRGRLSSDIRWSGELPRPRIEGALELKDGAMDIAMAGLKLRELNLALAADPKRPGYLALSGGLESGAGSISLQGESELSTGSSRLTLRGDDFDVMNTADAVVRIAPDVQLDWNGEHLRLRGQLRIPQAAITPQLNLADRLTGGGEAADTVKTLIEPSADVLMLNQDSSAERLGAVKPPIPIDAELDVLLGDAVRIDSAGFKTFIRGSVTLLQKPSRADPIPLGRGVLNLKEGSFRSFGQDLDIERGQITFDNVPVTEPELDIRAVRWIKNDERVTAAGLHLIGTLEEPDLEMFSRPPTDPETAQFYLLTGRAPDSEERLLSIGTQLRDDTYVGYGINLLERTHEFNLRYDVLRWLGLEAVVGEADKSLNFSYTWER